MEAIKEIYKAVLAVIVLSCAWTMVALIAMFTIIPVVITIVLFLAGEELRE